MSLELGLENCNCMITLGASELPAIRMGDNFFTPEGDRIQTPSKYRDMQPWAIKELMAARGEVYIGDFGRT